MEYLSDSYFILSLIVLVAFIAGFVDSIAGGGGFLTVPALMLAGIPTQQVIATNKLSATFGAAIASINFIRDGKVVWQIAILGFIGAIIGGIIGGNLNVGVSKATLDTIVMIILPISAAVTFIPKRKIKTVAKEFTKVEIYILSPLISLFLGIYDGFFGPGMGTFLIVAYYSILGLDMINASGVAKVINFASNISSLMVFIKMGTIIYAIGIPMLIATSLGSYIGSKLALKKGQSFIRFIMIFVFIIMFISLIYKYLK